MLFLEALSVDKVPFEIMINPKHIAFMFPDPIKPYTYVNMFGEILCITQDYPSLKRIIMQALDLHDIEEDSDEN